MSTDELLEACDAALLRSKRQGKGRVTRAAEPLARRSPALRRRTVAETARPRGYLSLRRSRPARCRCRRTALAPRTRSRSAAASYEIFRLDALQQRFDVARLPFSLKVLLENLLRTEGNGSVERRRHRSARQLGRRRAAEQGDRVHARPRADAGLHRRARGRGPRRDARRDGRDGRRPREDQPARARGARDRPLGAGRRLRHPRRLPRQRRARVRAKPGALRLPALGPGRLRRLRGRAPRHGDRPPGQPRVPRARRLREADESHGSPRQAYPDTLVGTDSHTTMVNGLGVLGWGVGGIEAEAAMLGQPMSMLIPQVLGFQLHGELPEGATATDLVLTVTEMLRERGVVGMFVEFYGAGLAGLPIADRATIGNMSPEFGSTCAIFPIDAETLRYLELSGRPPERIALVEAYAKEQGLWHDERAPRSRPSPTRSSSTSPASSRASPAPSARRTASPLSAGPGRLPARAARLRPSDGDQADAHDEAVAESYPASDPPANGAPGTPPPQFARAAALPWRRPRRCRTTKRDAVTSTARRRARPRPRGDRRDHELHEHLQPVGDDRRRASSPATPSQRGLQSKPWVKTSLAPGSKVVTEYLDRAGLTEPLEQLGFNLVGYGCTTCIGNSGPLPDGDLGGGQRGRPGGRLGALGQPQLRGAHQPRREDELPRLAAAVRRLRARRHDGRRHRRRPARPGRARARTSTCATSGPPSRRSPRRSARPCRRTCSARATARCSPATSAGTACEVPAGERFAWDETRRTCACRPTSRACPREPEPVADIERRARARAARRQRHHRPHLSRRRDQARRPRRRLPAGAGRGAAGLQLLRLAPRQPRGDDARHVRQHPPAQPARRPAPKAASPGTCARHRRRPTAGEQMSIYDAAMRYIAEGVAAGGARRARSTARAPRATGRPRARGCSACAR